jgi:glycosyltransferase involved in cell wall biosynthesis
MLISIVVPCYNEEAGLAELHRRLAAVAATIGADHEIILVDDGSRDRTAEAIRRLAESDPHVRGVSLSRNFGHQAALSAGIDHAAGDAVVVMDADLQHPPELIARFIEKWREGFDIVYGYREGRRPRLGYRIINALMQVRVPAEAADFRLMDRRVVDAFRQMPERSRFIRGMMSWLGFKQTGIGYQDQSRFAGERSYTIRQTLRMALDAVLSFSHVPLRIASLLGFVTLMLGLAYGVFILYAWWADRVIERGWTGIMMTVLVLGGVQLICLGIIAEYLGRVYEEVKRRPLYVVRERMGFTATAGKPTRPANPP